MTFTLESKLTWTFWLFLLSFGCDELHELMKTLHSNACVFQGNLQPGLKDPSWGADHGSGGRWWRKCKGQTPEAK